MDRQPAPFHRPAAAGLTGRDLLYPAHGRQRAGVPSGHGTAGRAPLAVRDRRGLAHRPARIGRDGVRADPL